MWSDYQGWHIWVVNGDGIAGLDGALVSDAPIERASDAAGGTGEIETINNVIKFTLRGDVPIAGIDVNPGFYAKQLRFKLDGPTGPYEATLVRQGSAATPATAVPLILVKDRY